MYNLLTWQGETRELLLEKHGEEEAVRLAAAEDSEEQGWLQQRSVVGLSRSEGFEGMAF